MVFFADKANSPYSISNPEAYLSTRAIDRRNRQSIDIDETDLPVNPNYVNQIRSLGVEVFFSTKWMNGVLVQTNTNFISSISALPFVTSIEYVAPGAILMGNSSGDFHSQSKIDVSASATQNAMVDIDLMHDDGFKGEGMIIGVFDGGFSNLSQLEQLSHLFSNNQIVLTKDFVINQNNVENSGSHGTRVLSIIASNAVDEMVGGAPNASFMLFNTEAPGEYRVEEYNWLFAAEMADSAGVDIINTSLGYSVFDDPAMDYTYNDMDGNTTVITRASNIASSKGILLITSAGNAGNGAWRFITAPADSEGVLAIGAVNSSQVKASFSSFGPSADDRIKPNVSAMGVGTAVVTANGFIANQNGTSFSAPVITGLAAGIWQAYPQLTNHELIDLIEQSGNQFNNPDNELGYGIPSYERAREIQESRQEPITVGISAYPNPISEGHFILAFETAFFDQRINVETVDRQGKKLFSFTLTPSVSRNRFEINADQMESGLYFLIIRTEDQRIVKKLIKY